MINIIYFKLIRKLGFEIIKIKLQFVQDALERTLAELKEKEMTLSKQNEILEAMERANSHLNEECVRNKEKLAQSQVRQIDLHRYQYTVHINIPCF